MVIVSDINDNNAERLYNSDGTAPLSTFQIPVNWDWAYYVRCVVMSTDPNVTIMKGNYAITKDEIDGSIRIPDLKLNVSNFTKETKYISSPNGNLFEITVDNDGILSAKPVDKDVIPPFDIPDDISVTITNNLKGGETLPFSRCLFDTSNYFIEINSNGITKYFNKYPDSSTGECIEHHLNSSEQERYTAIFGNNSSTSELKKGFYLFDANFSILDFISGGFDLHDYIYFDDYHYILMLYTNKIINEVSYQLTTLKEYKDGIVIAERLLDDDIIVNDILSIPNEFENGTHMNVLELDRGTDKSKIIINPRHCNSFYILERNEDDEGNVTFGNIIYQVGGLHSASNYNIETRIKTEEDCQWYLCHDVKYWGMKNIEGQDYPTYTLFDNNMKSSKNPKNPKEGEPTDINSRVIQLSIDFDNKLIKEYKIYEIDGYYSSIMSSAFMFDEGKILINYAMKPLAGYYDFTKGSQSRNTYSNPEKVLEFYSGTNTSYRVNPYNK